MNDWGYKFVNLDTRVVITPNVERDEYKNQIEAGSEQGGAHIWQMIFSVRSENLYRDLLSRRSERPAK